MVRRISDLRLIMTLVFSFLFVGSTLLAGPGDKKEKKVNKATLKAREAVANAAPDDWMTYAKSAELCIKKETNMKEAAEWLEKSLAIKKTSYNLAVMGDYYASNNLPNKAKEFYIASIHAALSEDINADTTPIQDKLLELDRN